MLREEVLEKFRELSVELTLSLSCLSIIRLQKYEKSSTTKNKIKEFISGHANAISPSIDDDNRHVIMIIPNSGHNLKNRKGYHGQKF